MVNIRILIILIITLLCFDIHSLPSNPGFSYTRYPDLFGNFSKHNIENTNLLFSVGTRIDGSSFFD